MVGKNKIFYMTENAHFLWISMDHKLPSDYAHTVFSSFYMVVKEESRTAVALLMIVKLFSCSTCNHQTLVLTYGSSYCQKLLQTTHKQLKGRPFRGSRREEIFRLSTLLIVSHFFYGWGQQIHPNYYGMHVSSSIVSLTIVHLKNREM